MQTEQQAAPAGASAKAPRTNAGKQDGGRGGHDPSAGGALRKLLAGLDFAQAAALLKPKDDEPAAAKKRAEEVDDDALEASMPKPALEAKGEAVAPEVRDPELLTVLRELVAHADGGAAAEAQAEDTAPAAPRSKAVEAEGAGLEELLTAAEGAGDAPASAEGNADEAPAEVGQAETPAPSPAPVVQAKASPKPAAAKPAAAKPTASAKKKQASPHASGGPLSTTRVREAIHFNQGRHFTPRVVKRIQEAVHVARSGSFDALTVQAVARFQRGAGITVDGMVGSVTMGHVIAHLRREHGLETQLTNAERGAAVHWNRTQHLPVDLVKKLQKKLGVAADGVIGPATTNAIASFQARHKLGVNGHLNPNTIKAIRKASAGGAHKPPHHGGGGGHFSLAEFRSHDGAATPQWCIPNLLTLIDQLEVLRAHFGGVAIHINSGYRSPAHNAAVGGERNSFHMKGMAADIVVAGKSPSQVHSKIERLIKQGKMKQGGLGLYSSFVHYDVRGYKARW